jgi:hypothetical protein
MPTHRSVTQSQARHSNVKQQPKRLTNDAGKQLLQRLPYIDIAADPACNSSSTAKTATPNNHRRQQQTSVGEDIMRQCSPTRPAIQCTTRRTPTPRARAHTHADGSLETTQARCRGSRLQYSDQRHAPKGVLTSTPLVQVWLVVCAPHVFARARRCPPCASCARASSCQLATLCGGDAAAAAVAAPLSPSFQFGGPPVFCRLLACALALHRVTRSRRAPRARSCNIHACWACCACLRLTARDVAACGRPWSCAWARSTGSARKSALAPLEVRAARCSSRHCAVYCV